MNPREEILELLRQASNQERAARGRVELREKKLKEEYEERLELDVQLSEERIVYTKWELAVSSLMEELASPGTLIFDGMAFYVTDTRRYPAARVDAYKVGKGVLQLKSSDTLLNLSGPDLHLASLSEIEDLTLRRIAAKLIAKVRLKDL